MFFVSCRILIGRFERSLLVYNCLHLVNPPLKESLCVDEEVKWWFNRQDLVCYHFDDLVKDDEIRIRVCGDTCRDIDCRIRNPNTG